MLEQVVVVQMLLKKKVSAQKYFKNILKGNQL